mgnify:CR=1 FL=1
MATCPECDAEIEVDEFEVDKGDELSCPECGTTLEVVALSPLELDLAPDEDDEDDLEPSRRLPAGTKNYITPAGYQRLRDELEQLWKVERPALVQTVAWAASNGDRSENGDYIYGKKRLGEIDGLTIIGKPKEKGPIVSFTLDGAHPHDIATIIDSKGVAVRAGRQRISSHHENTTGTSPTPNSQTTRFEGPTRAGNCNSESSTNS